MSAIDLPTLDLLRKANRAHTDALHTSLLILGIGMDSVTARSITATDRTSAPERLLHLLSDVCRIIAGHKANQNLTDWPFENFWTNPPEPRHSKLLGYFIDPKQEHGCGQFLLTKFLQVLEAAVKQPGDSTHLFPPENCTVDPESEYMDLLIKRDCADRRFAIIVENKVNSAVDQPKQLQTYVERVHERHGFNYHEIYVFYLPLSSNKHPARSDREWVEAQGAHYTQITFTREILRWLESAILDFGIEQKQGMTENLTHYRNLIRYLIRNQKELEMDTRILHQLRDADAKNTMPTLADLDATAEALERLRKCVQHVLRGRLMLTLRDMLKQQGHDVRICLENEPLRKANISSPFDAAFGISTNVCLRVAEAVHVCFGGNEQHKFWLGYLRDGDSEQQAKINDLILTEANSQLRGGIYTDDPHWFAWAFRDGIYDENHGESSPTAISNQLLAMRQSALEKLAHPAKEY